MARKHACLYYIKPQQTLVLSNYKYYKLNCPNICKYGNYTQNGNMIKYDATLLHLFDEL